MHECAREMVADARKQICDDVGSTLRCSLSASRFSRMSFRCMRRAGQKLGLLPYALATSGGKGRGELRLRVH